MHSTRWLWLNKMTLAAKSVYLMRKSQRAGLTLFPFSNFMTLRTVHLSEQVASPACIMERMSLCSILEAPNGLKT